MRDFVVVGAGPAGTRFARRAAEHGHTVTVLEQGTIGVPLACSGHVSLDIWDYLPPDARDTLHQNTIYGARFHLDYPPGDTPAYPFYKDDPVSNAIDRVNLDQTLATAATDAGASIHEHHTVTDVTEHPDHVTVTVTTPDDTHTIDARMIAGCDGPRSRVRRALDLPEPTELLHGVLGFDPTPDHNDYVDVHLTIPRFFAWRIPRGPAGVEYGLAARPGEDVPDRFTTLTDAYDATIDQRCSGLIPIGPPDRVTTPRGFLIGDAAAQTKPFTGGGILYGMTAADLAATAIDPTQPGSPAAYEQAWRDTLRREQRLGNLVRAAYALPRPVQRLGLWGLHGKIGVHMDRPTSLFTTDQLRALFTR